MKLRIHGQEIVMTLETYRGTVFPHHLDHMGHMNVMHYVGKFDEATWQFFATLGITPDYVREQRCGTAAVQQNITYKSELHAGDLVHITSRLIEVRERVFKFEHVMINSTTGEIAAICEFTVVHLDLDARKSVAFPPDIAARMRALLEG